MSDRRITKLIALYADGLKSKNRWAEAGRVLLEYARDVKGAVEALSSGGDFAEALRIVSVIFFSTAGSELNHSTRQACTPIQRWLATSSCHLCLKVKIDCARRRRKSKSKSRSKLLACRSYVRKDCQIPVRILPHDV